MSIRYKKMDRKSVAIRIGPAGVEVRLPRSVSVRDPQLKEFVLTHLSEMASQAPDAALTTPLPKEAVYAEVRDWAERLKVRPRRVQIRRLTSRWGSCTSRGNVTLTDRILRMPRQLREYVICHELAHLRYLDHGPQFHDLLSKTLPDWEQREQALLAWVAATELRELLRRRRRR